MATDDLTWAIGTYRSERFANYALYADYYEGEQRLAFATEKFRNTFGNVFREFAENICAPVVDSLSDRLQVQYFKTSEAEVKTEVVRPENVPPGSPGVNMGAPIPSKVKVSTIDPLGDTCLQIWERNKMDLKSNETHTESLKLGDSYVIVWPNEGTGYPEIWPQPGNMCCVQYDPNRQGTIIRGAKTWWDEIELYWYLNIYHEDVIVKYQQRSKTLGSKNYAWPDSANGWDRVGSTPNPYGQVPMFHFPNRAVDKPGVSELRDVIPLQDGLNKSVMDMLITMEFASFKQRWVTGMDLETDPETGEPVDPTARNYGVDRLMAFGDPETKIGQFDATDLGQFLRVQEKFWASVARVSGTPLHYFFITTGDFPSGEAMKSAEARFIKRITDRQTGFGDVWEQVMVFALKILGENIPEDLTIEAGWTHAAPRSEAELADTAVKKKAVGVARSQILRELGYDEDQILRMLQEVDNDNMQQMLAQTAMNMKVQQQQQPQNGQQQQRPGQPQGPGRGQGELQQAQRRRPTGRGVPR